MIKIQANLANLNHKLKANGHTSLHQSTIDQIKHSQLLLLSKPPSMHRPATMEPHSSKFL
jgi:hypothetical protein